MCEKHYKLNTTPIIIKHSFVGVSLYLHGTSFHKNKPITINIRRDMVQILQTHRVLAQQLFCPSLDKHRSPHNSSNHHPNPSAHVHTRLHLNLGGWGLGLFYNTVRGNVDLFFIALLLYCTSPIKGAKLDEWATDGVSSISGP